jgi:hypothetical protein
MGDVLLSLALKFLRTKLNYHDLDLTLSYLFEIHKQSALEEP